MTPADRLRALLRASGLTQTAYVHKLPKVPPSARTLRRWLTGSPMPPEIQAWLERQQVAPGWDTDNYGTGTPLPPEYPKTP